MQKTYRAGGRMDLYCGTTSIVCCAELVNFVRTQQLHTLRPVYQVCATPLIDESLPNVHKIGRHPMSNARQLG